MNKILLVSFVAVAVAASERVLCAKLSDYHNMGGAVYNVYASRSRQCVGQENNYYNSDGYMDTWSDGGQNNAVSSMQVMDGCWIETFCGWGWRYRMQTFHGWYYTNLVNSWDNCMSGWKCGCNKDKSPERRRLTDEPEPSVSDFQLPEQAFEGSAPTNAGPTSSDLVSMCAEEQDMVHMCTDACKTCTQCLAVAYLPRQQNAFEVKTRCMDICEFCGADCAEYFVCEKFGRETEETMYEDTSAALAKFWCQNFNTCAGH